MEDKTLDLARGLPAERQLQETAAAPPRGKLYLIGLGPGNPAYLSLRAAELLSTAELVFYDDLPGEEALDLLPKNAERVYVGKRAGRHSYKQAEITQMLISAALEGRQVLRLKGGDSFLFGRGAEELAAVVEAGLDFELVPGIASPIALGALAGIPLTERDSASSLHIFTGHFKAGSEEKLNYQAMVDAGGTLIFLMSVGRAREICQGLIAAGMPEDTQAAAVMEISKPEQRKVLSNLAELPAAMESAKISSPAVLVIGEVCKFSPDFDWYSKRPLHGKKYLMTRASEPFYSPVDFSQNYASTPKQSPQAHNPASSSKTLTPSSAEACELSRLLRMHGARVEQIPTVLYKELDFELPDFKDFDLLLFTSPRAVDVLIKRIQREADLRLLSEIEIVALGPGTAKRLAEYQLRADFMPSQADSQTLARELLERAGAERRRCLIPRSAAGSKSLVKALAEAYELVEIASYEPSIQPWSGDLSTYDYVILTSASAAKAFSPSQAAGKRALCIGSVTAEAAAQLGFIVEIAEEPSFQAMLEYLLKKVRTD